MAQRVMIDTNVLLDDLLLRKPHDKDSRQIINMCRSRQLDGYVAAHSFPDMFYIMRKVYTPSERRRLLKSVCEMFQVIGLDREKISAAIDDDSFTDFEDCLQEKCAVSLSLDYIITWNVRDFSTSKIKPVTPTEYLAILEGSE